MKGCRPLTDPEIESVLSALSTTRSPLRDTAFFLVGVYTGFRVSELLSLSLGDVYQQGRIVDEIEVARRSMKGKKSSRRVPFHNERARAALAAWIDELGRLGVVDPAHPLFPSREGAHDAIDRRTAWKMLKRAYASAGLSGKLATHTLRKSYAKKMKALLGDDLQALQQAMGHAEITSTMRYIEFDEKKLHDAFKKL
jgi:site-specific recombinase XerD